MKSISSETKLNIADSQILKTERSTWKHGNGRRVAKQSSTVAADVVVFEGVEKYYGEQRALKSINLSIEPGQFVVLLGPSGSGKSTMLRCLGGLEKIDGGEIRFGSTVVSSPRVHLPPDRRNLAMVFQDFALWPHMTVSENVGFALERSESDKKVLKQKVGALLEKVGLSNKADRYPNTLSGGEQQRVSLARALVASPGMILFDEPLSSLDAHLRERLRVEIAALTRESASSVLYITHDQSEAFALADVVGILDQGELVQLGKPETLYHDPATPFVAHFTGVASQIDATIQERLETGHYRVMTSAGQLDARVSGSTVLDSEEVTLMLRSAPIHIQSDAFGAGELKGRVVDVAYRGRGYDHVIETMDGNLLHSVFSEFRWERHSTVGIRIPVEACIAFPRQARSTES